MTSSLNELFYEDITLEDWEEMLAELKGEDKVELLDRLKNEAWQILRSSCETYEDVEGVSNVYAGIILSEAKDAILEKYPAAEVDFYVNCLDTSLRVGGDPVGCYDDLGCAIDSLTGLERIKDIFSEFEVSAYEMFEEGCYDDLAENGIINEIKEAGSLNSFMVGLIASDEELEPFVANHEHYTLDNCPEEIKMAVGAALKLKYFIDGNTRFVDTEVNLTDCTVFISCDVKHEGFVEIKDIKDVWAVFEMDKAGS